MNTKELLDQRTDNFLRAVNRNNPEYVPVLAFPSGGVIEFGNTTFAEVRDKPDEYKEAMMQVWEHIYADATTGQGIWYYPHAKDVMGDVQNYLGPDGISLEHIQKPLMFAEDYAAFIADHDGFVNETLMRRRYPFMFTDDMRSVVKKLEVVADDMMNYIWGGVNTELDALSAERYGIVPMMTMDLPMAINPVDQLFDFFRGFKGTMTDLRRHATEVEAALEILWEKRCFHFDEIGFEFPFVQQWPHMPAYMNMKQFEKFFAPYQKMMINNIHSNGNKLYILLEGKWLHLMDFFRDVPKDSCMLHCDDDDVIDISKSIGDHQAIIGGAGIVRTKMSSKEVNIDYTKKVLDECAGTGAFVFSSDKCWVCPGDVNQNLMDVHQYVHEHGKY